MDKKVLINILIGKEEEDLLGKMSKEDLKMLEDTLERCKGTLDRLAKKETTTKDIEDFIRLIEENHCRNCKYKKELEEVETQFYRNELSEKDFDDMGL